MAQQFKTAGDINPAKLAQSFMASGFKPGDFSETGVPDIALSIILKYYAYKAKRTTEQAERFYDAMSAVGTRTWIQQQLGWNNTLALAPYWYQRAVLFSQQNKVPTGYFSIFEETLVLVRELEGAGYVLPDNINADGKAFVSIRGAARIAGINDKTLGDSLKTAAGIKSPESAETFDAARFESAGINPSKLAQMLLESGFAPGDFFETGIPDVALSIILKYYAYKANHTTEQNELTEFTNLFFALKRQSCAIK